MARGIKGSGAKRTAKRRAADSDDDAPAVKKAKGTSGAVLPKKKRNLSMFKGLPLDLLREIFKYVSPSDLLSLCESSLLFHNSLCRASETHVWRLCRENEGVYELPDGMNEHFWAKLLFSSRCMECGGGNVKYADFYLRRRICKQCTKTKCISARSKHTFSQDALDCSLDTPNSGSNSSRIYWKAEVLEQEKTIKALKRDVEMNRPGATRALEEYKVSRRKLVRVIHGRIFKEAVDFEKYQNRYLEKKEQELEDLYQRRYEEIERRFLELGYLAKDFPRNMSMHRLVRSKANITERVWKGIFEALGPEIQARRDSREATDWAPIKASRRRLLDEALAAHRFKNIPHPLWKYIPQVHALCTLTPFDELITCDKKRELTVEDFDAPLALLDELVASAYEEARIRLRQRVIEAKHPFLSELESTQGFQNLDLATIVFRCKHCADFIFGFEDIRTHRCADDGDGLSLGVIKRGHRAREPKRFSEEFPFDCTFHAGASEMMCMVVEMFGLDPKTATTAQMDEKDLRLNCGCIPSRSHYSPIAFTWTDFLIHLYQCQWHSGDLQARQVQKKPIIVREALMPTVRDLEDKFWRGYPHYFACVYCKEYGLTRNLCHFERMAEHIQTEHCIQDPKIGIDMVDLRGQRAIMNQQGVVGVKYTVTREDVSIDSRRFPSP